MYFVSVEGRKATQNEKAKKKKKIQNEKEQKKLANKQS